MTQLKNPTLYTRVHVRVSLIFLCLLFAATICTAQTSPNWNDRFQFVSVGYVGLIQTAKPDGSGLTSIANGQDPQWAPDGTKLLYYDHINCSPRCLMKANADGTGKTYIPVPGQFTGANAGTGSISWFPDSQKFAFIGWIRDPNTSATTYDVYSMNLDGSGLLQLTSSPTQPKQDLRVAPDGLKMVYTSVSDYVARGVYLVNANGSGTSLLNVPNDQDIWIGSGEWSPDSTKLARVCTEQRLVNPELNRWELYASVCLIDLGGGRTNITAPTDYNIQNGNDSGGGVYRRQNYYGPVWSHDGSKLMYVKNTERAGFNTWINERCSIIEITADGGGGTEIFTSPGYTYLPAYSPDDSMILYYDSMNGTLVVLNGNSRFIFTDFHTLNGAERLQWKPRPPCDCQAIQRPPTKFVSTNWAAVDGVDVNWRFTAEVSDDDGLVLKDVTLGNRYLAKQISVPYYVLETTELFSQHNELRPDGTEANMRSRLVKYEIIQDSEKLVIEATYVLDRIPNGSSSCVHVVQRYEFYRQGVGGACEPSDTLPCSRWKPIVKYRFFGRPGQKLITFKAAQRRHFQIHNEPENSVGLFKDCDTRGTCFSLLATSPPGFFGFERKSNPLDKEWLDVPVRNGENLGLWDNIHQTNLGIIAEPPICFTCVGTLFVGAGCPECMHSHWRWGAFQSQEFGAGSLIGIPKGSKQDLEFAIVRNNPNEDDPFDYVQIINDEPIRHDLTQTGITSIDDLFTGPDEVVLWHVGAGHQNSDMFFDFGAFFSAGASDELMPVSPVPLTGRGSSLTDPDGITSVIAGSVITREPLTIEEFDPTQFAPLPIEYSTYNNLSLDVQTEAEISGPHTVTFTVPSVTDQAAFDGLRIFHAERDPFDPTGIVWNDRTILSPDTPGPDFAAKTISARVRTLGPFILATRSNPQPPPTDAADLSVSVVPSAAQVTAGGNITYSITVTNQGPQTATEIKLANNPSPGVFPVSYSTTQGNCIDFNNSIVCKLGSLSSGANAVVTATVQTNDSAGQIPPAGRSIFNTVRVKAKEIDANLSTNQATTSTLVMPDSNRAPSVSISTPTGPTTYPGPTANVSLSATASDVDGSISKVEFVENGNLIATVTSPTSGKYVYNWTGVGLGEHVVTAIATDNLGKFTPSRPVTLFVNGPATVSITSPALGTQFQAPANISITTNATYPAGSIQKVDLYADGEVIGSGTSAGNGQYTFTWANVSSGMYNLMAVATDNNGVLTRSASVPVTVYLLANRPPQINITVPYSGAVLVGPSATLNVEANATDPDGTVAQVDFYGNGVFLGTGTSIGSNQYRVTWSNLTDGSYTVTASARDDKGSVTTSDPMTFTVNTTALFVTGSTTLSASDAAVKNRLQTLGFTVTVKDAASAVNSDANGKTVVVISSSVSPNVMGGKFRYALVPLVTWESGNFGDLGLTGSTNKDAGTASRQTQIQILTPGAAQAGGLSGTVTVYNSTDTVTWGKPNTTAAKIASVVGDSTKVTIFGYYTGSMMFNMQAPARRVGLYMFDATAAKQTANGWTLFDASINWAVGRIS